MTPKAALTLLVLIGLLLSSSGAEEAANQALEQELLEQFLKANPNEDRKALVYMLVGQELVFHGQDDKAREYYRKAIETKSDENKNRAYIDLIMLDYKRGDQSATLKGLDDLENYWKQFPKHQDESLAAYTNDLRKLINKEQPEQFQGFLATQAYQNHFHELMKAGDYLQALALVRVENIESSHIVMKVKVDLLYALTAGRMKRELFCEPTFRQYPKAYSYSVLLCSLLLDFQSRRPLAKETIKKLEQYFETEHQHERYLLDMVKRLEEKS